MYIKDMIIQWTTMTYEVTEVETLVKYTVCHHVDTDLTFRVTIEPIRVSIRLSAIQEEHLDSICTTFIVFYGTTMYVQVTLT